MQEIQVDAFIVLICKIIEAILEDILPLKNILDQLATIQVLIAVISSPDIISVVDWGKEKKKSFLLRH